ncbi:MAG TPA: hypothetical protein VHY37_07155 [Tepidisphaeraceae bacterium]|jgi:hypothetical protein|nr:hypothetical protein [Tepidisphaeraceae bacterium]
MNQNLLAQDANLIVTGALPAATASTTSSSALDLDEGANGGPDQFAPERVNFNLNAPALSTTQLPDAKTVTYSIWSSPNADLSDPVEYIPSAIVQTGAGGDGAATANLAFALPASINRYLFANATTGSATGNCSAASMTLSARF